MPLADDLLLRRRKGLTPEDLARKRDLKRWRRRRHKARRVNQQERRSLGLQAGVGADDFDLERARMYRALEQLIASETRGLELRPLAKIGFDGRPPTKAEAIHPDDDGNALVWDDGKRGFRRIRTEERRVVSRNTSSSPLDYLYFQSKNPLAFWEWVVGHRFLYDVSIARHPGGVTVSLDALLLAKIETKVRRKPGEPKAPVVTFRPRRARRPSLGPSSVSDNRLDAMARIGRLADEVSKISFFLLEEVIGKERWLKDISRELACSNEYLAQRFREALWEAADHYRLGPSSRPRRDK